MGDVYDFMFENEQIRTMLAGQAEHVLVVILDPTFDHFAAL